MAVLSKLTARLPARTFVRLVAWQYRFSEPELRFLRDLVPPERSALDIGAWWGPWSWWLARIVPVVHAFEPNAEIATALTAVMPPNVRVHAEAVSDEVGWARLSIPSGGRGTEGRASLSLAGGRAALVRTVTLDSLDLSNPGFVKIDVEGHESRVLMGATRMLRHDRPNIVLEVEHQFHESGTSVNETFAFLTDMDYCGRFLFGGTWRPLESFDLAVHQLKAAAQVQRSGLMRNMLLNNRRYVNNFFFFPKEATPTAYEVLHPSDPRRSGLSRASRTRWSRA